MEAKLQTLLRAPTDSDILEFQRRKLWGELSSAEAAQLSEANIARVVAMLLRTDDRLYDAKGQPRYAIVKAIRMVAGNIDTLKMMHLLMQLGYLPGSTRKHYHVEPPRLPDDQEELAREYLAACGR